MIYGQPTTTIITTRSLFVTSFVTVYSNGFLSSRIGWMSLNGLKPPGYTSLIWPMYFAVNFVQERRNTWVICLGLVGPQRAWALAKAAALAILRDAKGSEKQPLLGLDRWYRARRAFHCCCDHIFLITFWLKSWELQPWRGACGRIIIPCVCSHVALQPS